MRREVLNVVCVKSRPKEGKPEYDHRYVNRLHAMVARNLSIPFRFVCYTDDPTGIKCPTRKLPANLYGWWAKLAIFKEGYDGKTLYLDLDTIIVGNLDFVDDYRGDFALLRDFYRPDGLGSGVMLWNRPHPHLWIDWLHAGKPEHELGDQGWMEQNLDEPDRLQDIFPERFVSFKVHCNNEVPDGAAVVCFHGVPKPSDLDENYEVDALLLSQWREHLIDMTVPVHVMELLQDRHRH